MADLTREALLDFFTENAERPWHLQDIQKQLKLEDRSALGTLLNALTDEGQLIRTRRRTYGLPQQMNLMIGKLQVTAGGNGFVIPEEGGSDLFVAADRLGGAWDGDKVVARPDVEPSEGARESGEIVRILERKHSLVVGTLEYSQGYAILRPDSSRLRERILLLPESVGKLEAGSRVVVRMIWPDESGEKDPFGEVVEFLGEGDSVEVETRAVIIKFGLKDAFNPDTIAEAEAVPPEVPDSALKGRKDLRNITTFTIDGADAKDFDDAISLERLQGAGQRGMLRVGIHIADVSHYVTEGSSLDSEAQERATSVYLPGKVLPMLPEQLSNGVCSLVEGEARLVLSIMLDMTRDGEVKGFKLQESVVQSDARLTYEQVQEFADGGRLPHGKRKLERDITALINISQKLREARLAAGALDFQFTEARVEVSEEGELKVKPVRSDEARQLIEELMLLANRHVGKELNDRQLPALFRVHEEPTLEKMEALAKALARLGYVIDVNNADPSELQRILSEARGKPEAQLVGTLLLRSLKQARYSAENLGHFGLAFENYLHFTSPIRRYPDLVVHRVVKAMLQRKLTAPLKKRFNSEFPKLGEYTSERERTAEDAERDLTRYFHARWALEHIGEAFQGVINGITNFGIFVSLPNGVEGLIHVSNLDDDYYMFLEESLMLMGKHTRKKYRLGDRIEVKLYQANPTNRQIDLVPASQELPEVEAEEAAPREKAPLKLRTPLDRVPQEKRLQERKGRQPRAAQGKAAQPRASQPKAQQPRAQQVEARQPEAQAAGSQRKSPAQQPQEQPQEQLQQQPQQPPQQPRSDQPATAVVPPAARPRRRKRRVLVFGDPGRRH
jgi:ribonuclease R